MRVNISSSIFATALLALSVASAPAWAQTSDPANDYIAGYQGPHNGDLDVLSVQFTLEGSNLVFTSTLNGVPGSTTEGFYVWGVDRGQGTARLAATGATNVLFDSVITLRVGGQSTVTDLMTTPAPTATNLDASAVTVLGNTLIGRVPLALLPSRGFDTTLYTANLWPRFGGSVNGTPVTGNAQIADFAPNNTNIRIVAAPEPAAVVLAMTILPIIGLRMRRRAPRP